jgi:hypothetical protein
LICPEVSVPVGIRNGENLRAGTSATNHHGDPICGSVGANERQRSSVSRAKISACVLHESNRGLRVLDCSCDEQEKQERKRPTQQDEQRRKVEAARTSHHESPSRAIYPKRIELQPHL